MSNATKCEILALAALLAWHVNPLGSDGGKRMHEQAPLFDTYVEERLSVDLLMAMIPRSQALFFFGIGLWFGGQFRALAERYSWMPDVYLDDVIDQQHSPDDDELPAAGLTPALIKEVVRIPEKLITLPAGANFQPSSQGGSGESSHE